MGETSEDEGENNERRRDERTHGTKACVLTFKDVEDSIDTFSGDDGRNIKQWIIDFEETASLCEWSEVQKTIYAKKNCCGVQRDCLLSTKAEVRRGRILSCH